MKKKMLLLAGAVSVVVALTVSCVPPKGPDAVEALIEQAEQADSNNSVKAAN